VTARVLHVSDFHLGRGEAPTPLPALHDLAAELEPDLLLVTGDLTHRGRLAELERAAELIRSLDLPFLAVPGNHDIPYTFPTRFTRTYARWDKVFGTHEPVYRSEGLAVVGLSSVRPWRQQAGRLRDEQLDRAVTELRTAPEGALRLVALHHHLAAPPWRAKRKRPLRSRDAVLRKLATARAELVVGGHVHQAGIAERREFEVPDGEANRSLVLATAPGFGRPRPSRKGEAQGANVYDADQGSLTVTTYAWDGNTLAQVARRTFPRA
jgi:3',5'-cyclic AMP phosphodiesterase CpdA